MQKNDTLRNLLIAGAIFYAVLFITSRLMPPPPTPQGSENGGMAQVEPIAAPTPVDQGVATSAPAGAASTPASGYSVIEATDEQLIELGATPEMWESGDARKSPFRSALTLTNVGAAIDVARTTDHAELLDKPERYRLLSPVQTPDGKTLRSLSVDRINIDGVDVLLAEKRWNVGAVRKGPQPGEIATGEPGHSAEFYVTVTKDGQPVLKLTRSYRLPEQPEALMRHDLFTDLQIENLSSTPRQVIVSYNGGIGIPTSDPRSDDRFVDQGIAVSETAVVGARHAYLSLIGKPGAFEIYRPSSSEPQKRFSWAATGNHFFTCTVTPLSPDGKDKPAYIAEVSTYDRDASAETTQDVVLRFVTVPVALSGSQKVNYPAEIFLGEKEVNGFRKVDTYIARNYYFQISASYGSCTFSWLVEMMIWLLNVLHAVVRDFGVAIIILVLIVRTLLHPITKKGQVNMVRMQHRMQEMAPKIEEIKKKYANDRARMNQEMMKLDLNPAGQLLTCLPMFIQMPIWIGLWISLSNNILMRHEPFLFTWVRDLSAPDALYTFAAPLTVPFFGWKITALNLLPFLLSITQYTQIKLQPKPKPNPNMTEEQRRQQEMMQSMTPIMVGMMFLIFYNAPSGLNLYVMASSFFGTLEQWRIRAHIREREEAGTLHKPLKERVLATATEGAAAGPALPAWVERLKKMAEDAQKVKSQRPGKGKKR